MVLLRGLVGVWEWKSLNGIGLVEVGLNGIGLNEDYNEKVLLEDMNEGDVDRFE